MLHDYFQNGMVMAVNPLRGSTDQTLGNYENAARVITSHPMCKNHGGVGDVEACSQTHSRQLLIVASSELVL